MTDDTIYSLILLIGAILVGWIISFILSYILKGRLRHIRIKGLQFELKLIARPFRLLIPALCISFINPLLLFSEATKTQIIHGLKIIIIFSVGWLAVKCVNLFRQAMMSRYDMSASDNLRARQIYTQINVLQNVISIIIFIITLALVLMTFSKIREIGVSILASAGVFGIIIGFSAQKTLGNLIAGIQLAITQPIRLDDVVIIEGEWGWIEEITLTFVVVRIWDLRRLVVPLSYFMEKPFQNWTRKSASILGTVFLYADYTIDVEAVRKELTNILEHHEKWDKKVNVLQVTNATDKTVELRALMSAINSPTAWELRCDVREKLLSFLQQNYPNSLPKVRLEMDADSKSQ